MSRWAWTYGPQTLGIRARSVWWGLCAEGTERVERNTRGKGGGGGNSLRGSETVLLFFLLSQSPRVSQMHTQGARAIFKTALLLRPPVSFSPTCVFWDHTRSPRLMMLRREYRVTQSFPAFSFFREPLWWPSVSWKW